MTLRDSTKHKRKLCISANSLRDYWTCFNVNGDVVGDCGIIPHLWEKYRSGQANSGDNKNVQHNVLTAINSTRVILKL